MLAIVFEIINPVDKPTIPKENMPKIICENEKSDGF